MDFPVVFPLFAQLARTGADTVRQLLEREGFRRQNVSTTTEIWLKLAGRGYAIVRIDPQGHVARQRPGDGPHAIGGISAGPHGGVPHYHKEWISAELLPQYLNSYVPQVVRYNDFGQPVTKAMNDGVAKATHIKA
jgi:hypothetical protein